MAKSDLHDISVTLHIRTPKAVFVSDDGDKEKAIWLPLSQIEIEPLDANRGAIVMVTAPEWLLKDKGLI